MWKKKECTSAHEELKPCPFCGGEAHCESNLNARAENVYMEYFSIVCQACWFRMDRLCTSQDDAIKGWNKRAEKTCGELKVLIAAEYQIIVDMVLSDGEMQPSADCLNELVSSLRDFGVDAA